MCVCVCAVNSGIGKLKTIQKKSVFECLTLRRIPSYLTECIRCRKRNVWAQKQQCINTIWLLFCRLLQFVVSFFMCVCVSALIFIYFACSLISSTSQSIFFRFCLYFTSLKVVIMKFSLLNMCELFCITCELFVCGNFVVA